MALIPNAHAKDYCMELEIPEISTFEQVWSPAMPIHGIFWYVNFAKWGQGEDQRLAVHLYCNNDDKTSNCSLWGTASFKLLPFSDDGKPIEHVIAPYVFDATNKFMAIGSDIKWDELINPGNNYVKDDKINLEIKVTAENPNDPNQSHLNFKWVQRPRSNREFAKFLITVSNILNLKAVQSPRFTLFGIDWSIQIFKSHSSQLRVALRLDSDVMEVPLKFTLTIKVIPSKKGLKAIEKYYTGQHQFSKKTLTFNVASWDEVINPKNGYISNDSIKLEVKFKVSDPETGGSIAKRAKVNPENEAKTPQWECPICFNPIANQKLAAPPCGHMFCFDCIKKAVTARAFCPTCNEAVIPSDLRPIFLPAIN